MWVCVCVQAHMCVHRHTLCTPMSVNVLCGMYVVYKCTCECVHLSEHGHRVCVCIHMCVHVSVDTHAQHLTACLKGDIKGSCTRDTGPSVPPR